MRLGSPVKLFKPLNWSIYTRDKNYSYGYRFIAVVEEKDTNFSKVEEPILFDLQVFNQGYAEQVDYNSESGEYHIALQHLPSAEGNFRKSLIYYLYNIIMMEDERLLPSVWTLNSVSPVVGSDIYYWFDIRIRDTNYKEDNKQYIGEQLNGLKHLFQNLLTKVEDKDLVTNSLNILRNFNNTHIVEDFLDDTPAYETFMNLLNYASTHVDDSLLLNSTIADGKWIDQLDENYTVTIGLGLNRKIDIFFNPLLQYIMEELQLPSVSEPPQITSTLVLWRLIGVELTDYENLTVSDYFILQQVGRILLNSNIRLSREEYKERNKNINIILSMKNISIPEVTMLENVSLEDYQNAIKSLNLIEYPKEYLNFWKALYYFNF